MRISEAIGTSFILAAVMPHLTRISSSLLLSMNFAVFLTEFTEIRYSCITWRGYPLRSMSIFAKALQAPPTRKRRLCCGPILAASSEIVDFMCCFLFFFPPFISFKMSGPISEEVHLPTVPLLISANSMDDPPRSQINP